MNTVTARTSAILAARRILANRPVVVEIMPGHREDGAFEVIGVCVMTWRGEIVHDEPVKPIVSELTPAALTAYCREDPHCYDRAATFRDVWGAYLRNVMTGEKLGVYQPICVWHWGMVRTAIVNSLAAWGLSVAYLKPAFEVAALVPSTLGLSVRPPGYLCDPSERANHVLRVLRTIAELEIES